MIELEGAELLVAAHGANDADALIASLRELGHGSLPGKLKLALLDMDLAASTSVPPLVPAISCNTHVLLLLLLLIIIIVVVLLLSLVVVVVVVLLVCVGVFLSLLLGFLLCLLFVGPRAPASPRECE